MCVHGRSRVPKTGRAVTSQGGRLSPRRNRNEGLFCIGFVLEEYLKRSKAEDATTPNIVE